MSVHGVHAGPKRNVCNIVVSYCVYIVLFYIVSSFFYKKSKQARVPTFVCLFRDDLHGIALPDFYIVSSFFYKKSKQARVPTFVCLFCDDATTAKGPRSDEGTNLH